MTVMFLHSCLPQANNSNLPSGGCLVITERCLLLFTLGFEHCKQRNFSLHCQTIYFISLRERSHVEQASFSCCPGVGLIHLWAWVSVSEPVCTALSVPQVCHGSTGWSKQWLAQHAQQGWSLFLVGWGLSECPVLAGDFWDGLAKAALKDGVFSMQHDLHERVT